MSLDLPKWASILAELTNRSWWLIRWMHSLLLCCRTHWTAFIQNLVEKIVPLSLNGFVPLIAVCRIYDSKAMIGFDGVADSSAHILTFELFVNLGCFAKSSAETESSILLLHLCWRIQMGIGRIPECKSLSRGIRLLPPIPAQRSLLAFGFRSIIFGSVEVTLITLL